MKRYATSIISKDATSLDRLLDETSVFLHRVVSEMPPEKREIVEKLHPKLAAPSGSALGQSAEPAVARRTTSRRRAGKEAGSTDAASNGANGSAPYKDLEGRKVLVVDDDMRNIFAITSMLESYGMVVAYAENGRDSIDMLKSSPDVEILLMDIMMPEMDGYETMAEIRRMPGFDQVPIIALTAKAMSGDREKCIAAGATDYIAKPVEADRLTAMMREYLPRRGAQTAPAE